MFVTTEGEHLRSGRFTPALETDRTLVLMVIVEELLTKLGPQSTLVEGKARATAVKAELTKRGLSAPRMEELRANVRRQALKEVEAVRLRHDATRERQAGKR